MSPEAAEHTQAVCAVIQAAFTFGMLVLTAWTLAVLRGYAADTRAIAKLTGEQAALAAEQLEAGHKPFLTLEFPGGKDVSEAREQGLIRNLGKGPALNIEYTTPRSLVPPSRWPSPLSPGGIDMIAFSQIMPPRWQPTNGFVLEYDSLSGRRYRTTVSMGNLWAMETVFQEVAPLSEKPTPAVIL